MTDSTHNPSPNSELRTPNPYEVIPAILVESPEVFEQHLHLVEEHVQTVQVDVLDGSKHGRQSFHDAAFVGTLKTSVEFELHLMVENPLLIAEAWKEHVPTLKRVIFHAELDRDHEPITNRLRQMGLEVGLAINPETPAEETRHDLTDINELLIMSVHPGASGQGMGDEAHGIDAERILEKIRIIHEKYPNLTLGCDGGVTEKNIKTLKDAGINRFCVGSAIFKAPSPVDALHTLQQLVI